MRKTEFGDKLASEIMIYSFARIIRSERDKFLLIVLREVGVSLFFLSSKEYLEEEIGIIYMGGRKKVELNHSQSSGGRK